MNAVAADESSMEPKWLDLSMRSGTVPPAGRLDIGVSFNAAGLNAGQYSAEIKVLPKVSGAPGPFVIPCNLTVGETKSALR